ncbi:MAG: putative transposase [Planctomycetota bacterium]
MNKLSPAERRRVVKVARSPEFRDKSPSRIVPALADRVEYIASESTFYRVLQEERLAESRGKAKAPQKRYRPSPKVATGPRQIWTWDITCLRSAVRRMFYYAYITVDIWSRKIVAAEVHAEETSKHAAEMMTMACADEGFDHARQATGAWRSSHIQQTTSQR